MLGFNVFAADSDEEAAVLATSMQQAFVNLRSGRPSRLQPPLPGYLDTIPPQYRSMLDEVLACTAIGSGSKVQEQIEAFVARTEADELMVTCQVYDHRARLRSYELAAACITQRT